MIGAAKCAMMAMVVSAPAPTAWNPADKSANVTLSNSNRTATNTANGSARAVTGVPSASANHYFEITCNAQVSTIIGIGTSAATLASYPGSGSGSYGYSSVNGNIIDSGTAVSTGATWTNGDVIGVLLKANKLYFSRNGVWQNTDPTSGTGGMSVTSATYYPMGYGANGNQSTLNTTLANLAAGSTPWG